MRVQQRFYSLTCGDLLLRYVFLEFFPEYDFRPVFADGPIVDQQEIGMVTVEDDVVGFGRGDRVIWGHGLKNKQAILFLRIL